MIKRTTFLLLTIAALASLLAIARVAWDDYYSVRVAERAAAKAQLEAMMGDATISLSLERSISQLGLGLSEPMSSDLRRMLDNQRVVVDGLFEDVLAFADSGSGGPSAAAFAEGLRRQLSVISGLRSQVDTELRVAKVDRTPDSPKDLPDTFKASIGMTKSMIGRLYEIGVPVPTGISHLLGMQRQAWAIREYGGRERTYMAIAAASSTPIPASTLREMKILHAIAEGARDELEQLASAINGRPDLDTALNEINRVYFGSYGNTRQQMIDGARRGTYSVSFPAYFEISTAALKTAEDMSALSGQHAVQKAHEFAAQKRMSLIMMLVTLLVVGGLLVACLWYISNRVVGRLSRLTTAMTALANGETEIDASAIRRNDEIGEMVDALHVFRDNAHERERLQRERTEAEERSREARQQEMGQLAESFNVSINSAVDELAQSTHLMAMLSEELQSAADQAKSEAVAAGSASSEAAGTVGTVAAATEELSATISDLAQRVSNTASQTATAAERALAATQTASELSESASLIGNVIGIISEIAEQTNLLALNATIEAARAGESGRGFAVVASEVKSLATQTAKATDEISSRVEAMQHGTQSVVSAIEEISGTLNLLSDSAGDMATAISQQQDATKEIADNSQRVAVSALDVERNVGRAAEAVDVNRNAVEKVREATETVSGRADALKQDVTEFVARISA
ncbi:MAG: HAMP domain-containing methyl-accepting chemotaxis protein [Pseudomonadota bacterium]